MTTLLICKLGAKSNKFWEKKLSTYVKIKQNFEFENYLTTVKNKYLLEICVQIKKSLKIPKG